jgi:SHS2 domain-containing protein
VVGRYTFLEDIALADCAVDVEGRDLPDLFETAASALARVMVDPATVPVTLERTIELSAPELDLLLYDWLAELIYRKDRDSEIFTQTRAQVSGAGPYRLTAQVRGGVIDAERTALGADPKAVTFHQFALTPVDGAWRARVVIDI